MWTCAPTPGWCASTTAASWSRPIPVIGRGSAPPIPRTCPTTPARTRCARSSTGSATLRMPGRRSAPTPRRRCTPPPPCPPSPPLMPRPPPSPPADRRHARSAAPPPAAAATRRGAASAQRRARAAGLDTAMRLDNFAHTAAITYDRGVLEELFALRFVPDGCNAPILGPVGVGKTFLATALGPAAIRARHTVWFERAGQLLKRLKAARLDNSHDEQVRKLLRVDLLILDDFCLQPMDAADTTDIYEIIVERHRAAATITTSNR